MTEIEAILREGKSIRDEDVTPVAESEVLAAQKALGIQFPPSYLEFLSLDGHAEMRISHRVLRPAEIVEAKNLEPGLMLIPFADNMCGDLYVWAQQHRTEPEVLFWDHDSGTPSKNADSFTAWLRANRF